MGIGGRSAARARPRYTTSPSTQQYAANGMNGGMMDSRASDHGSVSAGGASPYGASEEAYEDDGASDDDDFSPKSRDVRAFGRPQKRKRGGKAGRGGASPRKRGRS